MDSGAVREGDSLADVVELLLDKGVVINADIAVTVGETELLGIHLRAALASFETAAAYGLEFPEGTDMNRVAEAAGRPELAEDDEILVEAPVRERRGADEGDDEETDEGGEGASGGDAEADDAEETDEVEEADEADEIEAEGNDG